MRSRDQSRFTVTPFNRVSGVVEIVMPTRARQHQERASKSSGPFDPGGRDTTVESHKRGMGSSDIKSWTKGFSSIISFSWLLQPQGAYSRAPQQRYFGNYNLKRNSTKTVQCTHIHNLHCGLNGKYLSTMYSFMVAA